LKRALLYTTIAMILGLTMVLVPVTILANKSVENHYAVVEQVPRIAMLPKEAEQFGGFFDLAQSKYPSADFTVLAVGFAIALAAYLLVKRRRPRLVLRWTPPY